MLTMSALPPIADINPHRLECLLLAKSGHRLNAAITASLRLHVVKLTTPNEVYPDADGEIQLEKGVPSDHH